MRDHPRLLAALVTCSLAIGGATAHADTLRSSVFGNGGTSISGPGNSIRGTVGQAIIGRSGGVTNTLYHGWWTILSPPVSAVDPGAPLLSGVPRFEFPSPNPSSTSFQLAFYTPRAAQAGLDIFSVTGAHVRTLAAGPQQPGAHAVIWDARDDWGRQVSNGIYFAHLRLDGHDLADRRLVLIR
jgi:hypothetical protein